MIKIVKLVLVFGKNIIISFNQKMSILVKLQLTIIRSNLEAITIISFCAKMKTQTETNILILGGTNFMGKQLVDQLNKTFTQKDMLHIWLINRGKKYWNNQVYSDNPNIHYFYGDRDQHREMNKAVEYLNQKVGISENRPWTAVVDFSSFKWRDLQSVTKALYKKTELYIFISTDSIYNNSAFSGNPIKQDEFNLQAQYRAIRGTKVNDKYGYDKLKCQIYLERRKPVPFINLRLPDVLGPYDNTSRYWCLMQWIKNSHKHPLELNNKDKNDKLSFVSSKDVALLTIKLIKQKDQIRKYRSYNVSFRERVTYLQLINLMSESLNPKINPKIKYTAQPNSQSSGLYPSVNYTCIDPTKAIQQLKWNPQQLNICINECTEFFDKKAKNYSAQLRQMNKEYKRKVLQKD